MTERDFGDNEMEYNEETDALSDEADFEIWRESEC